MQPIGRLAHLVTVEIRFEMRVWVAFSLLATALTAGSPDWTRANQLYQQTEYKQSLAALEKLPQKDLPALQLMGQDFFMLGEYKKACEAFEKAYALDPNNPKLVHWLGRDLWTAGGDGESVLGSGIGVEGSADVREGGSVRSDG